MTETIPLTKTAHDVEFPSGDLLLRGRLWPPETSAPWPLVILAHWFGGLKEWTIPELGAALASDGIAAMSFDYRNFGDSDGSPREEVDHVGQIEDYRNAITYAAALPDVDAERIGIWGTSLGGRNVLVVAALDRRVRCVVSQIPPVNMELKQLYMGLSGDDEAGFQRAVAADRAGRAAGEGPRYVPFVVNDSDISQYGDYWASWGDEERRNFKARVTVRSFEPSVLDDIRHLMSRISPTPLRMVLASDDDQCPFEDQLLAYQAAHEPKSLLALPGGHYSVYVERKDVAIRSAREWCIDYLTPGS